MKKCIVLLLLLGAVSLTGCGRTVGTGSPQLESVCITAYNNGSEDSQYVQVELRFDREISVSEESTDSLRITVSGERIREYTVEMGADPDTALLTLPVEAVTEGLLYIGKDTSADAVTDICSQDGRYAAAEFEVQGIIPSGVTLATVSSEPGRVVKEVVSGWSIRSIAWVGLYENGVLIPASDTTAGEELDGYAAVHGHEFLLEDEEDIAEKTVEVLTRNYTGYEFSWDGTEIIAEKAGSDAVLDICVYQYIEVDGQRQVLTAPDTETHTETAETAETEETEEAVADEHESGMKIKIAEEDRTVQPEEQAFLDLLRTARYSGGGVETATELFYTLTITGDALGETQIYSIRDLEELIRLSFVNSNMNAMGLAVSAGGYYGLNFKVLLELCGVDMAADPTVLCGTEDGTELTLTDHMENAVCLLALSDENGPLDSEDGGPICLVLFQDGVTQLVTGLKRMTIGYEAEPDNPEYGYHDREPYLESEDLEFTIEVYREGMEYLGAIRTVSFPTAELEELMREYPECVVSGYYGTIGDEENYPYMGVGGWLDYYEGLDLYWLLTEQAGIEDLTGRAEFYDRDGALYSELDDLSYFRLAHEQPEEYYVLTSEGLKITGMIPMLATVKNGAPILAEHVHDDVGYIAYNTLNDNLEDIGVSTEVGVVKNHNGPFIACLGNRSGYYGGNQVETGNNCVTMRLYLK